MDIKKLRAFLTSVKRGSFSRAADELGYTQSGLTYMMNSLESELGCKLLRRGFGGVELTEQGTRLLPFIERCVAADSALTEEARELTGRAVRVRIGSLASISVNWLPGIVAGFQRERPGVSVDIYVGDPQLRLWLEDGSISVAFSDRSGARGFESIPLRDEPLLAVVPESYPRAEGPVTIAQLVSGPFIVPADEDVRALLPPDKADRRIYINSDDDTAIVSMVEQGLGVSILPELSLRRNRDRIRTLPLDPPCTRTLVVAYKSMKLLDPLTRAFLAYLKRAEF